MVKGGGMRRVAFFSLLIVALLSLSSCASTGYNTQKGAAIGAGIGAIAGQAIGRNTYGTLIGAGTGALLGAIVGNTFDQELIISRMSGDQRKSLNDTYWEECPPGKWVQVPGKWVGGKWVPPHRVWVPEDP